MKAFFLHLAVVSATCLNSAQSAPGPWQSLFNGTSLEDWEYENASWRVEDSSIVGEIPPGTVLGHNTWLIWKGGTLRDFELRLQFQIQGAPAANSGIQFRCQAESARHVSGYQADLDMGATWLGRIYDEHGRALLVERGTRVRINAAGERQVDRFAAADAYAVLFRENTWNDYRIRAVGEQVSIEINGTLFSELIDEQDKEKDLVGELALQLHSGPETLVKFRNIYLRTLDAEDLNVTVESPEPSDDTSTGVLPKSAEGRRLNLGFETGTLEDWTPEGDAFADQPVNEDGIANRWPGQTSGKRGRYFIGGYEKHKDAPKGTLTSVPFPVTHPYGSYLFAGGDASKVRTEVLLAETQEVIHSCGGEDREEMQRVAVDLRAHLGEAIQVRIVDSFGGPWGHLNFDDFRFHEELPQQLAQRGPRRLAENPILAHLEPNGAGEVEGGVEAETLGQLWLEPGFVAELIASEPDVRQPIAFAWDPRGRLWIAEAFSYPQKRSVGEGQDRLIILEDSDNDGTFETRKIFMSHLNLVSGLEIGHGGVWVGAAPELLFIPDRNGDDVPDGAPEILLDGFGLQDTHETLNSFLWGPDGWLYGNQGVFNESWIGKPGTPESERAHLFAGVWRYHPLRHQFEIFASGGSNQWGLDYDDLGEFFMTHCRSHFGKGATTHVVQGGHYWNQTNRNYASFISPSAPPNFPGVKNFLLASAPYGHGEGGAGKRGSRRVFGGHSHIGTLFYLGDNWPASYRNHLYTHNLHGHQINRQFNRPRGSGFETLHAGRDLLYSTDPRYIAVDLQTGPDGAVYTIDWTDSQHCHNPDTEQWDRSNGRVYRIAYASTYRPRKVDLTTQSDRRLAELIHHPNDWHVRMARMELAKRASERLIHPGAIGILTSALSAQQEPRARIRLRALWALQAIDRLNAQLGRGVLDDPSPSLRAWAIQLLCERASDESLSSVLSNRLVEKAHDPSPLVLRYLASSLPKLSRSHAWQVIETLSQRAPLEDDPNLPHLIFAEMARRFASDADRALDLADQTTIPSLKEQIYWYAAKQGGAALDRLIANLQNASDDARAATLELMAHGLRGQQGVSLPEAWKNYSEALYQHTNPQTRGQAEAIGATFRDPDILALLRRRLADSKTDNESRRQAFQLLSKAADAASLPAFLSLIDDPIYRLDVLNLLARFEDPSIPQALVSRFDSFTPREQAAALVTLSARPASGHVLLDAIKSGAIPREKLTAFHARQLGNLKDAALQKKLETIWGKITESPEALRNEIQKWEKIYREAPLWAYRTGKDHFEALCATCHQAGDRGGMIGPDLTGSGANGITYFLEAIITPNAVVGSDYQLSIIETSNGQSVAGMILEDGESTLSVRTLTESVTLEKSSIENVETLPQSLMPPGLHQALKDREVIELLKYLGSL